MQKRAYLMSGAHAVRAGPRDGLYDEVEQLNFQHVEGKRVPSVLLNQASTTSKTFQAPTDDDEDPESVDCY